LSDYTAIMETYLVGGAVRDKLLNLPVHERDWVVVGATAKMMTDAGYQQVGKDFPVFLHPENKEEFALARIERKIGKGYTGFECVSNPNVTLEDDLLRRDLTINAIAEKEDGTLIDPYGGVDDIREKLLRHVSPAFNEDPLRVLRVARFAARFHHLGFRIADETFNLMQTMSASGELNDLVAERIWKETEKALGTESPHMFFKILHECGALKVLFKEIDVLFGIPQTATYHPEIDTGIHTLMVLEQAAKLSNDITVRFAALVHDLGKGITPSSEWPRHIQHESRGKPLVKQLCQRLKVPNNCLELGLLACEHHLNCHRAFELRPITIQKMFRALDLYRRPERLEPFLLACHADACGRLGFEENPYPQSDYLKACFSAATAISSKDITPAGLTGKELGQLIEEKRIAAIGEVKKLTQATT
jgi:tRNA nucleotidyltransferase (CCA-adding enzyme)